jgi:hypothetical protein
MRIEDSEPESTSSDDEEESPYRQEPSPPESPTATAQCKRKGKNIRTASHEHSQGTRDDDSDGEYEGISVLGPQPVESGAVTHFNVRMRPPVDPEHRNIVNYKGRGMIERARKEREKNPLTIGGRNLDYRFGTKFHQDYYASAIIKKDFPIARSEYIDWGFLSVMEDPKTDLVYVHLYLNKDRSSTCLRHAFGYVTFPFTSFRMASVYSQIAFYSYVSSRLAS